MMIGSGIAEFSRAAGLDPIIVFGKLGRDVDMAEAERLLSHRAAGAIMIATPVDLDALATFNTKLPVVYIGGDVSSLGICCVHNDDVGGARVATEHLIKLGHKHIAHISGGTTVITKERVQGYEQAMLEAGLMPVVYPAWLDIDGGRAGVDALMVQPTRPTAIFAGNDRIAIGAINRLRGLGYRVPEDVSVAGFDNITDAGSESLSLTTLDQHPILMAQAAVELMREILGATAALGLARTIAVDLIVRKSTSHPTAG
jgi:LacI family transcriptional regulator